jgi:hypothetical protein
MNAPIIPASRMSIAAVNSRTWRSICLPVPHSVSGMRNVVSKTRKIEMPSMPVLKWTPIPGIHSVSNTSWKGTSSFGSK